jgi:endonuclease/exonuclease/phosphatase family metal-dependent hydrolase
VNPPLTPRALTIASYNIHKAVGSDGRREPTRILDVLDEMAADVALLQEADTRLGLRTSVLPEALLAARGWQAVPLGQQHHEGRAALGWHGNAVLLRGDVRLTHSHRITLPSLGPRGAVLADISHGNHVLRLVGAHLDLSGLARARQMHAIIDAVAKAPGNPPELLMGDFNEWRRGGAALAALGRHWREVALGPSFPARLPIGRLDRVFAHHALKLADSAVHASALARVASDHLPIWVRLAS